jgi:hypothetical protein
MASARTIVLEPVEPRRLLAVGTLSEQIIVDQFGWRADAPRKVVLFADPTGGQNSASRYTPGATFEVRRVSDDGVAFSGSVVSWHAGAIDASSLDKVWSGDFSALTTPGDYYVYDPATQKRSYPFRLDNNLFDDILKTSDRTYYYQRSGTDITAQYGGNWTHPASHVGPNQDTAAQPTGGATGPARDLSGGWYDAGDFNRYVPFTTGVIWDLLSAYEWNPGAFGDDSNIPESGNGAPDLLDEVKWETDWLLKMQTEDGSVLNRVGDMSYNVGSGPAADTQPRYYTRSTTWATASFAASAAHAARIFAQYDWQYPGYAARLQAAAEKAWSYLELQPTMFPASGSDGGTLAAAPAGSDAAADKRLRILASAELWKTTGNAKYRTFFEAHYKDADAADNGLHPLLGSWPHFDPAAATDLKRAFMTYATTPGATASIVTEIKTSLRNMVDGQILASYTNGDDPYRAFMWDGHYTWGSNQLKSQWANLLTYAIRLNVNPANNARYREAAEEYLHYFHGRNALSEVYLSNMGALGGDKSPMQMYHGWFQDGSPLYDGASSTYGPAPGYLEGGPNRYFSVSWVAPPYGQPEQKAYKDWNTAWNTQHQANENSWEVTEPAIYYQAAYTLLLSQYATDTHAPTARSRFDVDRAHVLTLQFSEDIGNSLSATDLQVDNLTNPASPAPAIGSVAYDPNTRRATVTFSPGILPDGNYRVTLPAGAVTDPAGNANTAAASFDFYTLAGDANRDRVVNFADLLALAKNYNKTGATFDQGDFNYDGNVNFADLLILAKSYNKSLAAPAPAAASAAAPVLAAATSSSLLKDEPAAAPVFSTARVTKPAAPKPPKSIARPAARR